MHICDDIPEDGVYGPKHEGEVINEYMCSQLEWINK